MIKSLHIKYQSHRDTRLEFSPGVNAIIGKSTKGKTAIIRAIRWALENRPKGKRFIPFFDDHAKVKIFFDNGSITHKKGKQAKYTVVGPDGEEKTFRKYAAAVPAEVRELARIDDINIQDQLSQHFLITSNPAEIAKTINRITNQQSFDVWTKDLNSQLSKNRSRLRFLSGDLEKKEKELKSYAPLKDAESCAILARQADARRSQLERDLAEMMDLCDAISASQVDPEKSLLVQEAGLAISKAESSNAKIQALHLSRQGFLTLERVTALLEKKAAVYEAAGLVGHASRIQEEIDLMEESVAEVADLAKALALNADTIDRANIELDAAIAALIEALKKEKKCPVCLSSVKESMVANIQIELGRR